MVDDALSRDRLILVLGEDGVESTLGTYGLHLQPYFRDRFGDSVEALPEATRAHHQSLTLPLHPAMSTDDVHMVCESLVRAIARTV